MTNQFLEISGALVNPDFIVCITAKPVQSMIGTWQVTIFMTQPYESITIECKNQNEADDLMMDLASQLNGESQ